MAGNIRESLAVLSNLDKSDWISIVDIAITSGIGIWIAITVQNNLTKNRYLKEHFISEIKNIQVDYKKFINSIYKQDVSSKYVLDWFKIMGFRIKSIESSISNNYKIGKDRHRIYNIHTKAQKSITNWKGLNDSYAKIKIELSYDEKTELLRVNNELSKVFTDTIIKINSGKSKKHKSVKWWKFLCYRCLHCEFSIASLK